jgi:histidinol-phosphatase (PHP family)
LLFDYHIHTARCHHAEGTMEQYVQAALAAGLAEMGFSDHLPIVIDGLPPYSMTHDELPLYVADVLALREKYRPFPIRLGVEVDYFEGFEQRTADLLRTQAFDYVFGSAHMLPPGALGPGKPATWFCIDAPEEIEQWRQYAVDDVWRAYLRQLEQLARTGFCQVIGHCDLPKKFGFRHGPDILKEWPRVAETFARYGVLCEINTAGLRKPVKEIYPSLAILKILRTAGVGITLGSDSHRPQDVAADFAGAVELARAAGYDALHRWKSPGFFEPVKM